MESIIREYLRSSDPIPPSPFLSRNEHNQLRTAQSHQYLSNNSPYKDIPTTPIYPPRRSSLRNSFSFDTREAFLARGDSPDRHSSRDAHISQSTISSHKAISKTFSPMATPYSNATRYESLEGFSGPLGNFVPIERKSPENSSYELKNDGYVSNTPLRAGNFPATKPFKNPFEFEPDSPFITSRHQTAFGDFINPPVIAKSSSHSPRPYHVKNSRSENNTLHTTRTQLPHDEQLAPKPLSYRLSRSDSSPSVTQSTFNVSVERDDIPRKFKSRFHETKTYNDSPNYRHDFHDNRQGLHEREARKQTPASVHRSPKGEKYNFSTYERLTRELDQELENIRDHDRSQQNYANSTSRHERRAHAMDDIRSSNASPQPRTPLEDVSRSRARSPTRSPTYTAYQSSGLESMHSSTVPGGHSNRSPTRKALNNVMERNEDEHIESSPSPKKRSRSPMKKMFGEKGWLGRSPDELQDIKTRPKKYSVGAKDKPGMIGRLKNKIEEFAEKADLSPLAVKNSKSGHGKPPKLSILTTSLIPIEQAKFYMELEVLLVLTANQFLMSQFCEGRLSMDTVKKAVDGWKSKGRTVVFEFMYDQVTQRDIVAANQHNLRFYGPRAGDPVRINSTLYTWKLVSNYMAVRTFCDADTVLMKLMFDVEQILLILGAKEMDLLKLQQLRSVATEMMRQVREKKAAAENIGLGHETSWSSKNATTSLESGNHSIDSPYGGLKLVPDFYFEDT